MEGLDFEKSIIEIEKKIEELKHFTTKKGVDFSDEIKKLEQKADIMRKEIYANLTPWQKTLVARHIKRPKTLDYINLIFKDFIPMHGDRLFRDDPSIVGGLAKFDEISVVLIGHQKGKDIKDSIYRNFGMANPEGYRKALKLMKLAEKFKKPVITFVDTPAAYPGIGAEERGQAEAIARNLREMSNLNVPIIVVVHGEGGSGGALGIAVGDRILMLENAIYSVIPPEGCAAILWKDSSKAPQAAESLKFVPKDLLEFGIIDEIINEPNGGAHRNHNESAENIKSSIRKHLNELIGIETDKLLEKRYNKFRNIGRFEIKKITNNE